MINGIFQACKQMFAFASTKYNCAVLRN